MVLFSYKKRVPFLIPDKERTEESDEEKVKMFDGSRSVYESSGGIRM